MKTDRNRKKIYHGHHNNASVFFCWPMDRILNFISFFHQWWCFFFISVTFHLVNVILWEAEKCLTIRFDVFIVVVVFYALFIQIMELHHLIIDVMIENETNKQTNRKLAMIVIFTLLGLKQFANDSIQPTKNNGQNGQIKLLLLWPFPWPFSICFKFFSFFKWNSIIYAHALNNNNNSSIGCCDFTFFSMWNFVVGSWIYKQKSKSIFDIFSSSSSSFVFEL